MATRPRTAPIGILLVLALPLTGCATGGSDDPFSPGDARRVEIEAVNLNWNDATLYVLRNGHRQRIGVVAGKGDRTFTVDWPSTYEMRIEIDVLTRGTCVTAGMHVDPGDSLRIEIPPGSMSRGSCGDRSA